VANQESSVVIMGWRISAVCFVVRQRSEVSSQESHRKMPTWNAITELFGMNGWMNEFATIEETSLPLHHGYGFTLMNVLV